MAKNKAETIANKDEKLQVDTNSSVPETAPIDGEVKEPKDAQKGEETKQEEKPLDNNDTISELQKQILENGLEGLEETAAGGNAGGAEGGVSLSAASFEQGGHESNIRETFREVDPYGHPVDLNGLMGNSGISGSTTPPRDTTPPNEPKIEIDHPNGKVIITPDPLTTEGGDTTTINYTDDNGNSKSATYAKGSDGDNSYSENGTIYGMSEDSAREGFTANFNVRLDKASDGEQRFSYETVKDGLIDIDTDHVTFTNGVKLSDDGHSVIVPAGVKDFTVSYNTTKNDLVDKDTAFTLKINGVSYDMRVHNYEEIDINGPENGSVPSAVEGNKVVFNVDMGKAASYEKSYDYTQSLVDTSVADYKFDGTTPTGNAFWPTFTNGVRLSDDGKKIIVPAGVKNFQVIYDTLDDNIVENHTEEFHISIGTKTFMGAIYDNDTSSITNSTTGSTQIAVSVIEGRDITFDVNVSLGEVEQRFSYYLMDETANKRVDYDPKMEFTNGVKMSADGRDLIVPAGVSSFKITVHTIQDERVEEDETFSFYLGNTHVQATILNDDVLNFKVEQPTTEALNNGIGNASDIVNGVKAGKDIVYKVSANGVFPEAREYDFSFDTTGSVFDKDHATFSNGVTYDKTTGKITIPSGVDSFNVTIPTIAGEYTDGNSIAINVYNASI